MTQADGISEEVSFNIGDVGWADAEKHLPESLGDGLIEVVLVELKE